MQVFQAHCLNPDVEGPEHDLGNNLDSLRRLPPSTAGLIPDVTRDSSRTRTPRRHVRVLAVLRDDVDLDARLVTSHPSGERHLRPERGRTCCRLKYPARKPFLQRAAGELGFTTATALCDSNVFVNAEAQEVRLV